jgi:hypothetical protein
MMKAMNFTVNLQKDVDSQSVVTAQKAKMGLEKG